MKKIPKRIDNIQKVNVYIQNEIRSNDRFGFNLFNLRSAPISRLIASPLPLEQLARERLEPLEPLEQRLCRA